jgi:hypothetical protein
LSSCTKPTRPTRAPVMEVPSHFPRNLSIKSPSLLHVVSLCGPL